MGQTRLSSLSFHCLGVLDDQCSIAVYGGHAEAVELCVSQRIARCSPLLDLAMTVALTLMLPQSRRPNWRGSRSGL